MILRKLEQICEIGIETGLMAPSPSCGGCSNITACIYEAIPLLIETEESPVVTYQFSPTRSTTSFASAMAAEKVKLPDFIEGWPYPRHLNQHYEAAKAESREWSQNFQPFDAKSQDAFDRCDFGTWLPDPSSCLGMSAGKL